MKIKILILIIFLYVNFFSMQIENYFYEEKNINKNTIEFFEKIENLFNFLTKSEKNSSNIYLKIFEFKKFNCIYFQNKLSNSNYYNRFFTMKPNFFKYFLSENIKNKAEFACFYLNEQLNKYINEFILYKLEKNINFNLYEYIEFFLFFNNLEINYYYNANIYPISFKFEILSFFKNKIFLLKAIKEKLIKYNFKNVVIFTLEIYKFF